MNPKLLALKLFLDELQVNAAIDTLDDRKRVQKATFLGQIAGADLGYRFGWYIRGPYSPELTRDYYALDELKSSGEELNPENKILRRPMRERLEAVRPLLDKPDDFPLSQEDWLELVASYHYLRKINRLDHGGAAQVFGREKPHLTDYLDRAHAALHEYGLLG
jgi:hypothetical protein